MSRFLFPPSSQGGGGGGTGAVESVNGKTGVVILNAMDVGAVMTTTFDATVSDINNKIVNINSNLQNTELSITDLTSRVTTIESEITSLNNTISQHMLSTINSENGSHNLRYFDSKLEILNGDVWETITTQSSGKLAIHRETYRTDGANFPITLSTYDTTLPTLVFINSVLLPESDYSIVESNGSYSVILNTPLQSIGLIEILVYMGNIGTITDAIVVDNLNGQGDSTNALSANAGYILDQKTRFIISTTPPSPNTTHIWVEE
jgi:hypothetical protein